MDVLQFTHMTIKTAGSLFIAKKHRLAMKTREVAGDGIGHFKLAPHGCIAVTQRATAGKLFMGSGGTTSRRTRPA